jgi:hypothetical protein
MVSEVSQGHLGSVASGAFFFFSPPSVFPSEDTQRHFLIFSESDSAPKLIRVIVRGESVERGKQGEMRTYPWGWKNKNKLASPDHLTRICL